MAQAKRKSRKNKSAKSAESSFSSHGIGMLLIGMVVGSVATALYMGSVSEHQPPLGSGIKHLIDESRRVAEESALTPTGEVVRKTEPTGPAEAKLDFYTVLPEIEEFLPDNIPVEEDVAVPAAEEKQPVVTETVEVKPKEKSFYMLQAGSYAKRTEAEQLKAQLAINGLSSSIQEVFIQNRGNFYRVRLGPYEDRLALENADRQLGKLGIRGMQLKVSKQLN